MADGEGGGTGGGLVLGNAIAEVRIETKQIPQAAKQAGEALEDLGRKAERAGKGIDEGIKKGADGIKDVGSNLRGKLEEAFPLAFGIGIGSTIAGGILEGLNQGVQFVRQAIDNYVDEGLALGKLNQVTGATVEDLSALSQVAAEGEIEFTAFAQSMTIFANRLEATKGAGADMKAELFAIADQFSQMPDGPAKTALAMDTFGRSGAKLIPILNQGSVALQAYMGDIQAAGLVMTTEGVAAANAYDDALDRLNRSGQALSRTIGAAIVPSLANYAGAAADVVSPTTSWQTKLTLLNAVLNGNAEAVRIYASGMAAAANATNAAAKSAGGAIPVFATLGLTLDQLQKQYADLRTASDRNAAFINSQTTAAAALADREARDLDRREVMLQKTREYNQVYFDNVVLMQNADREQARLERGSVSLTAAQQETEAVVDKINAQFERQETGAGGAASATEDLTEATDALAEAQDRLQARTALIGSTLGSNLDPMSETEKFQKAWAIAAGETTLAEVQQEAAVKSVMKALEEKKISQEDALATLLALQVGLLNANEAMTEAGDPSKLYNDEIGQIAALAEAAAAKVDKLGIGVNTLPSSKRVAVNVEITGGQALLDAHERMAAMKDTNVKLAVEVAGLDKLRETLELLRQAGFNTSPFGPGAGGGAPGGVGAGGGGGTTSTPAPGVTSGTSGSTPTDASDRGSGRGVSRGSTTIVQVGPKVVAEVLTEGDGTSVVKANTRRSWARG